MKIEINHWDFWIKTLEGGEEVVQLNSRLAFDKEFIKDLKEKGVRNFIIRDQEGEEEAVD